MREVTKKIYTFEELRDDVQQEVIEKESQRDIYYDWHEFIYMDAETIGLKITGFDCGYRETITGDFTMHPEHVAKHILKEHGESCETHKLALAYLNDLLELRSDESIDNDEDLSEYGKDELRDEMEEKREELAKEFLHDLLQEYLCLLRREYENITSEAYIREYLISNECEFYEDGKSFYN